MKNMKKLGLVFIIVLACAICLCGCSKDEKPYDYDLKEYITLGSYPNVEVDIEEINDAVNDEIEKITSQYKETKDTDRTEVKDSDTVNIDYEGKRDGVAFDGGTAQGSLLTIGSGRFIDGFEEGLIGVTPGETVDLNLTFPENYSSADLAGQDVVFTVTVNFILPQEMEDAVAASVGIEGVGTVEELRQYAYDYLYANAENSYNTELQNAVLDAFMQNCVFEEVPQYMVEEYETVTRESLETQAESYGMDADTMTSYFYGMDVDTFMSTYSEEAVRQDIAMQAVANREGLNIDDEELNTTLLEYANNAGYDTVEEYVGDTSLEDYRDYLMYEKVLAFLTENAVVNQSTGQ